MNININTYGKSPEPIPPKNRKKTTEKKTSKPPATGDSQTHSKVREIVEKTDFSASKSQIQKEEKVISRPQIPASEPKWAAEKSPQGILQKNEVASKYAEIQHEAIQSINRKIKELNKDLNKSFRLIKKTYTQYTHLNLPYQDKLNDPASLLTLIFFDSGIEKFLEGLHIETEDERDELEDSLLDIKNALIQDIHEIMMIHKIFQGQSHEILLEELLTDGLADFRSKVELAALTQLNLNIQKPTESKEIAQKRMDFQSDRNKSSPNLKQHPFMDAINRPYQEIKAEKPTLPVPITSTPSSMPPDSHRKLKINPKIKMREITPAGKIIDTETDLAPAYTHLTKSQNDQSRIASIDTMKRILAARIEEIRNEVTEKDPKSLLERIEQILSREIQEYLVAEHMDDNPVHLGRYLKELHRQIKQLKNELEINN